MSTRRPDPAASPGDRWEAVDRYYEEALGVADDPALAGALRASAEAGLPAIHVSPLQGRLLQLLAAAAGARAILEVGTLGGFSTLHLARAAAETGGRVLTLELEPRHAAVARANLAAAGLADRVEVREGRALDLLATLGPADGAPFDFTFIDADKAATADYFAHAVRLSRPGALVVVDNVVRGGRVADAGDGDANVRGIRRFVAALAAEPRAAATAIQTVGAKGHDGFVLARLR